MARWAAGLAAAVLAAVPAPALPAEDCAMAEGDRAWLSAALQEWRRVQSDELAFAEAVLPTVTTFDAVCAYTLPQGDFAAMRAVPNEVDMAKVPEIGAIPIGPVSFAYASDGFVMSLPSVWRAGGVSSEIGLERLMTGVLLHEIAHTRQTAMMDRVAEPVAKAAGIGDELNDDLMQERFAKVAGYEAATREEIAALFAAAAAPDRAGARGLAAHALGLMRARRARWFSGSNAHWAVLDDVFLTMEGTGQWLIYRHLASPQGAGLDPAAALRETRRGGRFWSQDEGLALMLVLDRLLPDWRARLLREPDWLAENLLAAAVGAHL